MRCKQLLLIFILIMVFAACNASQSYAPPTATQTPGPSTPTPIVAEANAAKANNTPVSGPTTSNGLDIPPEVAGHEKEWPLANHDYSNTRAAVGSSINSGNVADLKVAWTASLEGTAEWGGGRGNPVISDGIAYFQDLAANTYAVNLETGDLVWETEYNNQSFGPSGPGIGYGRVYVLSRIDRYSALDIKTGKELWLYDSGVKEPAGAFQPYVFGHQVYVANQAAPSGKGQIRFHSY